MTPALPIERLHLPSRVYNALIRGGIDTLDQLRKLTDPRSLKGINERGAEQIRMALKDFDEVPEPKPFHQRS